MIKRLLDRIGYISIRTYLAILLCLVIPLFVMFGWVRTKYEVYIQEQISEQIVRSISKSEDAIYNSFRNIAKISSAIVTNKALLEGLSDTDLSYYSINKLFDECVDYVQVNNLYNDGEMFMTLFDRNGQFYTNWERNFMDYSYIMEEDWVIEAEHGKGHLVWNLFSSMPLTTKKNEKYISAARAVYDGASEEGPLGVLIVSMPQNYLSQVLKEFCYGETDSVYMMGDGDEPILKYEHEGQVGQLEKALSNIADNESGSFVMNMDKGIKLISYYTLDAPWTLGEKSLRIVHFTDFGYVLRDMYHFSKQIKIILVITALSTLVIVGVIVRMLVKPIRKLSDTMRHYKLGDSLEGLDMTRKDEIGYLNRSFRRLTINIKELFNKLNEEYLVKERYRYESLRSQLNPHFLFNALNTIRYISIMQHADAITEGIDALATVLKYSIGHDEKMTKLSDEVEHVKGYLEIQNMRFGQKIHLEEDFEPRVMAQYMPRFILQPIVENAAIHGFRDNIYNSKECRIRLYGFNENNVFHLYVEDNGEGVDQDTLEKLNNGMYDNGKGKMTGIGFSHVKKLIEMTFGREYTLEITSYPGIGTVAHYKLPIIEKTEETVNEKNFDCR